MTGATVCQAAGVLLMVLLMAVSLLINHRGTNRVPRWWWVGWFVAGVLVSVQSCRHVDDGDPSVHVRCVRPQ